MRGAGQVEGGAAARCVVVAAWRRCEAGQKRGKSTHNRSKNLIFTVHSTLQCRSLNSPCFFSSQSASPPFSPTPILIPSDSPLSEKSITKIFFMPSQRAACKKAWRSGAFWEGAAAARQGASGVPSQNAPTLRRVPFLLTSPPSRRDRHLRTHSAAHSGCRGPFAPCRVRAEPGRRRHCGVRSAQRDSVTTTSPGSARWCRPCWCRAGGRCRGHRGTDPG